MLLHCLLRYCQTPIPGETQELTLLLHGNNNKNKKKKNLTQIFPGRVTIGDNTVRRVTIEDNPSLLASYRTAVVILKSKIILLTLMTIYQSFQTLKKILPSLRNLTLYVNLKMVGLEAQLNIKHKDQFEYLKLCEDFRFFKVYLT